MIFNIKKLFSYFIILFFNSYNIINSFKKLLFFKVFYGMLYKLSLFLVFFNTGQFFNKYFILL